MAKNSLNKWLSRYSKKQKLIFGLLGTATLALVALLVWLGVTGRLGISAYTTGRVYFTAQTGTSPQNAEVPKTWRTSAVKVTLSQAEFEAMGYPNTSGENSDAYKTYFDKDKHVWHISITSDPRYNSNSKDKWGYFVIQSLNSKEEVLNQITDNYYAISNIIDFPVVRGAKYARVQYHTKDGKFLPWWKIDVSKINPNEKTNDANLGKYDDSQVPRNFVGRRCLPGSGQIAVFSSADYSASRINSYDIELGYERACEILPAGNYVNLDTTKYPADFGYLISNGGPYSSPIHTRSGEQVYGNSYPMNDAISSILVKNATVQVYKNASYSGDSKSINSNTASFDGTGFNDNTISSLKVVSTVPPPPTCMLSSDPTTIDVTQGASASTTVKAAGGTVPTKANTEIKVWSGGKTGTTLYTKNDFTVDSSSWPKLTINAGLTLAVGPYTVEVIDKTNACTSVPILVSVEAQCQLVATPNKLNIDYQKSGSVTISANKELNPDDIGAMVIGDSFEFTPSISIEKSGDLKYKINSLNGSEGKTAAVLFADNRNVASKCGQVTVPITVGNIGPLTIEPVKLIINELGFKDKQAYTVAGIINALNTNVDIEDKELAIISRFDSAKGLVYVTVNEENKIGTTTVTVSDKVTDRSDSAELVVDTPCPDGTTRNDTTKLCEPIVPEKCGENEELNENNVCVCINGYNRDEEGRCVAVVLDPLTIGSFTADPPTIEKGNSSTLSWEVNGVTDDTTCEIVGLKSIESKDIDRGSHSVSPIASTTYRLSCSDNNRTVTSSVRVEVTDSGLCGPNQIVDMAPTGIWEIRTLPVNAITRGLTLDKYLGLGIVNYFFNNFGNPYGTGEEGLAEDFTGGRGYWRKNNNSFGYICMDVEGGSASTARVEQQLPFKALNMVSNPLGKDVSFDSIKFKFSSTGEREVSWNEATQGGLLKAVFFWNHPTNSYLSYTNLARYKEFTRYGYQDFSAVGGNVPHGGMWISTRSTDTVKIIFQ